MTELEQHIKNKAQQHKCLIHSIQEKLTISAKSDDIIQMQNKLANSLFEKFKDTGVNGLDLFIERWSKFLELHILEKLKDWQSGNREEDPFAPPRLKKKFLDFAKTWL